jgi:hypothetical protein
MLAVGLPPGSSRADRANDAAMSDATSLSV